MKRKVSFVSILFLALTLFLTPMQDIVQGQSGVTVFSNLSIQAFFRTQPRTAITVTDNSTINATGTYQRLTAAGAVGTSGDNLTIKPAGTLLTLVNVGSNTITITETANIKSAGNVALGTLDTATFLSDGSDWYQVSGSNN